MVKIRKARLKDLDRLIEVWERFMDHQRGLGREFGDDMLPEMKKEAPEIARNYFSRTIRSVNGLLLVIEGEGEVQGYILSTIAPNIPIFKKEKVGYVSDIYLEEPYRGKGIARDLFDETLRWFESRQIKEISIKILHYNSVAETAYIKWGFKKVYNELRMDLS